MRWALGLALIAASVGCSQRDTPAEQADGEAEIASSGPAQPLAPGRFAPRNECSDLPGADQFRSEVSSAVQRRDANALAALAAEDIKLDFGGGSGAVQLHERLADQQGTVWQEFDELLSLGCSANAQGGITIPWVADQELQVADPAMAMLVMGEDVPVRESPDEAAPVVSVLSWDVVTLEAFQPGAPFQHVKLPDDTLGFIRSDELRSMLDYRLTASSRNGRWSITSFLAGD